MKCINVQCQKEIGDVMFCPHCGTKQVKPKVFCVYCGSEMDEDAVFCDNCGRKSFLVQQREEAEQEERNRQAQEAERKRLEEQNREKEQRERVLKEKLASEWTTLYDPNLAFRLIDGPNPALSVKMLDVTSGQTDIIIPSSVRISDDVYTIASLAEGAFSGCTALHSVLLPSGIEEIPARAFKNCSALSSIDLPGSVKEIGEEAFSGTGLTSIILPESLEHIDFGAFMGCRRLNSVVVRGEVVRVQNTSFDLTPFINTLEYKGLINSHTLVNLTSSVPELYRLEKENLYASRDYPYCLFVFSPRKKVPIFRLR